MSLLKAFIMEKEDNQILLPVLRSFAKRAQEAIEKDSNNRKKQVIRDAKLSIACLKERILEFNHGDTRTKDYFHPSQIGQCLRKQWLKAKGVPPMVSSDESVLRSHFTFEVGTYFHILFQNLCHRAGVLEKREAEVVDHERKLIGHADGILDIPKHGRGLLEIKTINNRGFTALTGPKPEHKDQANIYANVLGLSYVVFIYYNKDTSEVKEYTMQRDPVSFKGRIMKRVEKFNECLATNTPPEKEGEGPSKYPCSYCEFAKACYSQHYMDNLVFKLNSLSKKAATKQKKVLEKRLKEKL